MYSMDLLHRKMSNLSRKEILRYIKTEKEISKYSIEKLEKKSSLKPLKKRILEIEREFVSLPLEQMDFEDVADVAAAISIYRSSRGLFYKSYDVDNLIQKKSKKDILEIAEKKLGFLSNLSAELMTNRVQEVNVVQDMEIFQELVQHEMKKNATKESEEKKRLGSKDLGELIKIEPLKLSKKRARLQASLCSLGMYIHEHVRACELNEDLSEEELLELGRFLDFVIYDSKSNIFKHYNVALQFLSEEMKGTMGQNKYLSKIHGLVNLLDYNSLIRDMVDLPTPFGFEDFSFDEPSLTNLFLSQKDMFKSRVFGILLPIQRKSNEKLSLLYSEIYHEGSPVDFLFSECISNVKAIGPDGEEYYKAILLRPLAEIEKIIESDNSSEEFVERVCELGNDSLELSSKKNIVLAPKTRSEEQGLMEILPIVESKIVEFSNDYFKLFGTTNENN